jgi:hypothetical protein
MLSPPHIEGGIGALRVEARGRDEAGARVTHVIGVAELIGTSAAATAAAMATHVAGGGARPGVITTSDPDLPASAILRNLLRYGVRLQEFTGIPHTG